MVIEGDAFWAGRNPEFVEKLPAHALVNGKGFGTITLAVQYPHEQAAGVLGHRVRRDEFAGAALGTGKFRAAQFEARFGVAAQGAPPVVFCLIAVAGDPVRFESRKEFAL